MNVSKVLNKMFDLVFIRRVKTVEAPKEPTVVPCEPWWEEEKRRTRVMYVSFVTYNISCAYYSCLYTTTA